MRARSLESPRIPRPAQRENDHHTSSTSALRALRQTSAKPADAKLGSSLRERATLLNSPAPQEYRHFYNCADESLASDDISEITSERSCTSGSRSVRGVRSGTAASSIEPHPLSRPKSLSEKSRSHVSSDVSEDSSPRRQRGASKSTPGAKGLSPDVAYLLDFARGGAEKLAAARPQWRSFNKSLVASVETEVEKHVKTCSKCRAFSSFSKHACGKKKAALNEHTFASLCREQHTALNEHIAAIMLEQKDVILTAISESMSIGWEELLNYDAVHDVRLDPDFASLGTLVDERDRVLQEAHMREDLSVVLAMMKYTRSAHRGWRAVAARFPHRKIDHQKMSVVMYEDVEECAVQQLHHLSSVLIKQMREWETKWEPVAFQDVFCLFGAPLYEKEYKLIGEDLDISEDATVESWTGWKDIDEAPLTAEDIACVRPMSVVVRIRPFLSHEAGDELTSVALDDGATVAFKDSAFPGATRHHLVVDAAIEGDSQAEFFARSGVKALVHKAVLGSVATVFAYGQTGAGKTHSLLGPEGCILQLADDELLDPKDLLPSGCRSLVDAARRAKVCRQGLIPRAVQFLWKLLSPGGVERSTDVLSHPCSVKVSFLEVYNDKIFDLLRSDASQQLEVRQRSGNEIGFHVPDLSVVRCDSPEAVLYELRQGILARHTQGHSLSRDSSRAHAIFTIELEQGGKLVFADLAGSERPKRVQGAAAHETAAINKSLFALSNCISTLAASGAEAPTSNTISSNFRSSKLTKLLMDSLIGNGYTLLVAAASPAARHADETAATFAFAAKCAHVRRKTAPTLTPHEREVRELQAVISSLREELAEARQGQASHSQDASLDREDKSEFVESSEELEVENEKCKRWMEIEAANTAVEMEKLREDLAVERQKSSSLEERMQLEGTAAASQIERMCVQLDAERRRGRDLCQEAHAVNSASEEEIISLRTKLAQEQDRGASLQQEVQAVGRIAAAEIEELCKQLESERRARREDEHKWATKMDAQRSDRSSELQRFIDRMQEDQATELTSALGALQEELTEERRARESLSEKVHAMSEAAGNVEEGIVFQSLRRELQEARCLSEVLLHENTRLRQQIFAAPAVAKNLYGEEGESRSSGDEGLVSRDGSKSLDQTCSVPGQAFVSQMAGVTNVDTTSTTGSQNVEPRRDSIESIGLNLDNRSSAAYLPCSAPCSPEDVIANGPVIGEEGLRNVDDDDSGSACGSPAESTFSC